MPIGATLDIAAALSIAAATLMTEAGLYIQWALYLKKSRIDFLPKDDDLIISPLVVSDQKLCCSKLVWVHHT